MQLLAQRSELDGVWIAMQAIPRVRVPSFALLMGYPGYALQREEGRGIMGIIRLSIFSY